jgi:hypothetical protein
MDFRVECCEDGRWMKVAQDGVLILVLLNVRDFANSHQLSS